MKFTWDIDPVLIDLWGPFQIRYYGLIFSLVFIGGYLLFRWQVRRAGGSDDDALDLLIPGMLGTVIGARLGHVLFYNLDLALSHPLWVFQVWRGGLASHGAALGLLAAMYYYARRHKQSLTECLDRFSFSAALGAMMIRIANFLNSEIVGRQTGGDWGVRFPRFDGLPNELAPLRHPSQLYEAGLGLGILILLFLVDRKFGREQRPRGILISVFVTTYFSGRFLVEFFKEYHVLPANSPLTMGQYLSIPLFCVGVIWMIISIRAKRPVGWNIVESPPAKAAGNDGTPNHFRGKSNRKKKN